MTQQESTGSGKQKIQSMREAKKMSGCCEQRGLTEAYEEQEVAMRQVIKKERKKRVGLQKRCS